MNQIYKFLFLISVLSTFNLDTYSQCVNNVDHWEAAVLDNQTWKYIVPNTTIPNWYMPNFNDASWQSGQGGMGFGDNDDNTIITNPSTTVYMRRSFTIIDTSQILSAFFCMDYDDGFVAYLNGIEIARSNMNGTPPAYNALASGDHEAQLYQNLQPDYFAISAQALDTILKNGINVLCIETHNFTANSSDLTSRPFLILGMATNQINYYPTPAWYNPPAGSLYTNLPIIVINTNGQNIVDDLRIICDMGIIYNGLGNMNCITDPYNNYNGKIAIEFRGSTSQNFPKKPYGFSTIDGLGNNLNVSLLGMPAEHDWVLLNPYTDKTFMRDVLIHSFGRELNWYTSRTQFVELVINGQLRGVYVLMEKIKRDDNRVNISKLTPNMNAGDSLTGGYILKIDKMTGNSGGQWYSSQNVSLQSHYPKWNQITMQQETYIKNYINNFESVLWGGNYANPNTGYRSIANVYSFVDFFIINEISNNIDGYRLSTFLHKDRKSRCGRITMGPYWDFNLSYGNADYCNGYPVTGWQMYQGCGDGSSKWINRMLQDQWFRNMLNCRWNDLRQNILSTPNILARVDSFADYVRAASKRDSAIWQTIGNYIWPNGWIANTWQGEIDSMKQWIIGRMNWIDANMYPTNQACNAIAGVNVVIDEINFHSDVSADAGDWLELYNYGATAVDLSNAVILDGDQFINYCVVPNGTILAPGARLIVYADSAKFAMQHPIVTNKIGPLCFKLSNGGQKIVLKDKDNRLIFSMTYDDQWQCSTDGHGRTIQLTNPTANPNLESSWYAGCMGGSPGNPYTTCVENSIFSEINYNPSAAADAGDWIELHNKSTNAINLTGWQLKDGNNNAYVFPAGTSIAAGAYLVVYSNTTKFLTQHPNVNNKVGPTNFGFNNITDAVKLYDNTGKVRFSVCYKNSAPWPTLPNGGGTTLENAQYAGNQNASTTWFSGCPKGSPGFVYSPCWPANIEEQKQAEYISVYPNPSTDIINILTSLDISAIKILDNTGRVILQKDNSETTIDISKLAPGLYNIQCIAQNRYYLIKFVKTN